MACIIKQDLANEKDRKIHCVVDGESTVARKKKEGFRREPCVDHIIKVSVMSKKIDYFLMLLGVKTKFVKT